MRLALAGDYQAASKTAGFDIPPEVGPFPFFEFRVAQLEADASALPWLTRAMVLKESNRSVGHTGFHGPPGVNGLEDPEAVEFGCTVAAAQQRRGYAEESARGLFRWAATHGVPRAIASIAPDNEPSLQLAAKLGMRFVREVIDDEDGPERVFVIDLAR